MYYVMSNPVVDSNMHGQLTGCRDKTVAKKKCNAAEIYGSFQKEKEIKTLEIFFFKFV